MIDQRNVLHWSCMTSSSKSNLRQPHHLGLKPFVGIPCSPRGGRTALSLGWQTFSTVASPPRANQEHPVIKSLPTASLPLTISPSEINPFPVSPLHRIISTKSTFLKRTAPLQSFERISLQQRSLSTHSTLIRNHAQCSKAGANQLIV